MNPGASQNAIGRLAFLGRFVLFLIWMLALFVALEVAIRFAKRNLDYHLILFFIVLFWLAIGGVVGGALFFRHALLPRLNDIGLRGAFRTFAAALWLIPPINPFLIAALLLAPKDFVHE